MENAVEPSAIRRAGRSRFVASLLWAGRFYARCVRFLVSIVLGLGFLGLGILFVNYIVLSTEKATAYRNLDPASAECRQGLAEGWPVLSEVGRRAMIEVAAPNDGGWIDVSNDEDAVVREDGTWATRLRCSLQRHVIPATTPEGRTLDYHLGFLEFQEDGEPYALVARDGGRDVSITSVMLQGAMENPISGRDRRASAIQPVITQLDALKQHLSTGSHYVLIFVHGWRHDARIGDGNVADLRLYAAHAARFLAQRCPSEPSYCEMKVTAVYVGWRGARVDERGLRETFGRTIGGFLGDVSAAATLFDRKPVSEAIAPAAISALRTLESVLAPSEAVDPSASGRRNRMVVAGHSLGGNMLATGLKDDVVKAVRRHRFGETFPSILGNLVLLINPAAEATKWTTIQREVWNRIAIHTDARTSAAEVIRDNGFFPADQRPVMMSVTAALAFPAGGLRTGDCAWIGLDVDDRYREARRKIRQRLGNTDTMFDSGVDYDWATHDLFPTFKFDFRPAAGYLYRAAARFERRQPPGESCAPDRPVGFFTRLLTLPIRTLALLAETFPFQDSQSEQSHTIGNLDAPRPAAGVLADTAQSAAPFGTTHELLGLSPAGAEPHHAYATLADAPIDCPLSNGWLSRARAKQSAQFGMLWNSEDLAPREEAFPGAEDPNGGRPSAQFLHGLHLTGIAPITRANDPFWNVRAFDNALSRHDGYRLTSFICAMSQIVMDDITANPAVMTGVMSDPTLPSAGQP